MKFGELLELFPDQDRFDLASAVQVSGCPRNNLKVQLHRWCKAGKLSSLRRGMYAFSPAYRKTTENSARLANELYTPSYLSLQWALGFYGLIPEAVFVHTSVTSRVPKTFVNERGTFTYRHVKPAAFFGYRGMLMGGEKILLADPEKALLDFWHLTPGKWTRVRMAEMRFQQFEAVEEEKLVRYAERFASPRLIDAVHVWKQVANDEVEGTVEL